MKKILDLKFLGKLLCVAGLALLTLAINDCHWKRYHPLLPTAQEINYPLLPTPQEINNGQELYALHLPIRASIQCKTNYGWTGRDVLSWNLANSTNKKNDRRKRILDAIGEMSRATNFILLQESSFSESELLSVLPADWQVLRDNQMAILLQYEGEVTKLTNEQNYPGQILSVKFKDKVYGIEIILHNVNHNQNIDVAKEEILITQLLENKESSATSIVAGSFYNSYVREQDIYLPNSISVYDDFQHPEWKDGFFYKSRSDEIKQPHHDSIKVINPVDGIEVENIRSIPEGLVKEQIDELKRERPTLHLTLHRIDINSTSSWNDMGDLQDPNNTKKCRFSNVWGFIESAK